MSNIDNRKGFFARLIAAGYATEALTAISSESDPFWLANLIEGVADGLNEQTGALLPMAC